MPKLNAAQVKQSMAHVPGWRKRGQSISRTFEFKDFPAAMKFTNAVARVAEKANHHPDIDIRWNRVLLRLTTHDAGGLTSKDFDVAGKISRLA